MSNRELWEGPGATVKDLLFGLLVALFMALLVGAGWSVVFRVVEALGGLR